VSGLTIIPSQLKPMFDLSFDSANEVYSLSHTLLISGSLATVLGTLDVFWAGGIRDRYADDRTYDF
jgi:hypothetical protein